MIIVYFRLSIKRATMGEDSTNAQPAAGHHGERIFGF